MDSLSRRTNIQQPANPQKLYISSYGPQLDLMSACWQIINHIPIAITVPIAFPVLLFIC